MLSDFKCTIRSLLKAPGFVLVAILTLALGIGANTAIFSIINGVLLSPEPYAQPERLARIYTEWPSLPNGGIRRSRASGPEYLDLQREAHAWQSIDAWRSTGVNIASDAQPIRATASFVTGGMFHTLGVGALYGRTITPRDAAPGAQAVAVISHGLWQRDFGGVPNIVGHEIFVNGEKTSIIGVMPASFRFPLGEADSSDLWVPLQLDPAKADDPTEREMHRLELLGRLKSGVPLGEAQAELNTLVVRWGKTRAGHTFDPRNHTLATYGLHDEVVRAVRPALQMLMGAAGFLLLIACVNVTNLLLVRAESRKREIAIRYSLGATLGRLTLQSAMEGGILALSGAAVGVLLAQLGLRIIQFVGDQADTRLLETSIDGKTISFTVALSVIVSLVFSMAPLVHLMGRSLHDTLKSTSGAASGTVGAMRFRQIMIVSQLSLALVLLIGTGLMLRSFWKLQQVDAGFDPRSLVTASVGLSGTGSALPPIWTRIADRVTQLPGVESSALTTALPPSRPPTYMGVMIEGFVPTRETPYQPVEFFQSVTAGYFKTFGIKLLEGRLFDERDTPEAPRVVIINAAMARTFWGNRSPLGHRVRIGLETDWRTVVGVVSDIKNDGLEKPTGTEVFLPYTQPSYIDESVPSIVIRSQENGSVVISELRRALKQIDATIPLVKVRTMTQVLSAALSRHRFLTLLLTLFAAVALVLATVGVYGIVSYSSAQRTKEFGIRIALGAEPNAVLRLVLQRGVLLTACGIVLGLLLAFWLTRLLSAFLFGITAADTETFVVVCLVLGAIAVAASYIPARRATKIDPLAALRAE